MADEESLKQVVSKCLAKFYAQRKGALKKLRLKDLLEGKNPYVMKARGVETPEGLVSSLLDSRIKESDETIFGRAFFEDLATWAAEQRGGRKSSAPNVDVEWEDDTTHYAVSMKSSTNWGNAAAWAKLQSDFEKLRSRHQGTGKEFHAISGSGSGRASGQRGIVEIKAGQALWEFLTGDPEFYLRIARLIDGELPLLKAEFDKEREQIIERFTTEFKKDYGTESGGVNWDKLVELNSGRRSLRKGAKRGGKSKSLGEFA